MKAFRSGFTLSLLVGTVFLAGCGSPVVKQDSPALATARTRMYDRSGVQFAQAAFFKPSEAWTDELGAKLAPLLMQEVAQDTAPASFGRLVADGKGLSIDASKPTLYFRKDKIWLKGAERDQAVFLWFYGKAERIIPQGVRITLDSDGHPGIWEILNDTSGIQQIFASQSLEAAGVLSFSAPLPDRRSVLERSVTDAPQVTVSRVISDGPMAMGPAIYLDAVHHDVVTLICRCMPPQAGDMVSSASYEVAEMSDPSVERLVKAALDKSKVSGRHWLNEGSEEMEMRLRLPSTF